MSTQTDYYELLECERTADAGTIKSSYRKLAMKYHPDKNAGCKDSEAQFKAVSEAYECLKDPQKRAAYDRFGHAAFQNGGGGGHGGGAQDFGGFSDIFESVFGEFMGGAQRGGGRSAARRGADLRYDMEVSLEEAFHGKTTEITIDVSALCDTCDGSGAKAGTRAKTCQHCGGHGKVRAQQGFFVVERACPVCNGAGEVIADPCPDCRGEGRVEKTKTLSINVPPGVDEGTRIRMSGEGEAGARGAPSGDLYIFLHVTKHNLFEREGTTLFARAPISFTVASLGGSLSIPGLDGRTHEVKIPAGIQSGKQLRQRGAGMPVLQGRGHGDLVVQIDVETPTRLSNRQKELLEMFRETETGDECPASQGFFAKLKGVFAGE
ncbi:molecular chaperone DnaJ [Sphingomonas sp. PP-F2F-A104-K0414]|jgi:molecular chaperone DnaJ|uniref:molecular chaperone DnaJ n=1 Tax=Sphingomonas TaxID=13687 RepID=UPI0006FE8104|nr:MULTISPECIES: molecular chaperone DnaJ [unclassified Sphingomonas]RZM36159.1 MAG: molecular chaperone DnaJ [Sphingomonas sp.]KQM48015.1 molecular chaperone DnaJ [Sphingomonas sp. Leaf208]KQS46871.1 molecular chaperone DnaJ [Sphingomonas sp. Leaf198]RMB52230.1 molecular chaperone DnaJ [Sphingomonas sp. PP-CE-3A-406]TCP99411.1 molecular chaperone DnaJ [Sphingomonas sp. PP-F2F-A104-K0414]